MNLTSKEQEARNRVCLALDVPSVKKAIELSQELAPYVGIFKIGKQIHTAAGMEGKNIVKEIYNAGGDIFLDLKYHDTPGTVFEASKASVFPGVLMFNIHISGGKEMCESAIRGAKEGALERGLDKPQVIGVTELTSLNDDDLKIQGLDIKYNQLVENRTKLAKQWGLDGIVCPAKLAGNLEKQGYDFTKVTPGIKWAGIQNIGQKQLYTPDKAIRDCENSILVIGSAITKAGNVYEEKDGEKILVQKGTKEDRQKASYEILQAMAKEL